MPLTGVYQATNAQHTVMLKAKQDTNLFGSYVRD